MSDEMISIELTRKEWMRVVDLWNAAWGWGEFNKEDQIVAGKVVKKLAAKGVKI